MLNKFVRGALLVPISMGALSCVAETTETEGEGDEAVGAAVSELVQFRAVGPDASPPCQLACDACDAANENCVGAYYAGTCLSAGCYPKASPKCGVVYTCAPGLPTDMKCTTAPGSVPMAQRSWKCTNGLETVSCRTESVATPGALACPENVVDGP